jgi:hypothetical protein
MIYNKNVLLLIVVINLGKKKKYLHLMMFAQLMSNNWKCFKKLGKYLLMMFYQDIMGQFLLMDKLAQGKPIP